PHTVPVTFYVLPGGQSLSSAEGALSKKGPTP
ncbi:MAG: hypothetical protein QOH87_2582, partial [Trebonia sp.]|nr:hypothetical protein [Trebonia sp.]